MKRYMLLLAVLLGGPSFAGGTGSGAGIQSVPFPDVENTDDTICSPDRRCTAREFQAARAAGMIRWKMTPRSIQRACASLRSLPALDRCLMSNVQGWSRWNPDDGLPWLPDGTL